MADPQERTDEARMEEARARLLDEFRKSGITEVMAKQRAIEGVMLEFGCSPQLMAAEILRLRRPA